MARAKYDSSKPLREAIIEWGPTSGQGMPFRRELALDVDQIDEDEQRIARLHNLGYSRDDDPETNLRRFQNDHGLLGERGFSDDGTLPPKTRARLDEYYGGASGGQEVGIKPGQLPRPVAPRCSLPFPGINKAAKDLTLDEARSLLAYWHNNGDIQLIDDGIQVIDPFDAACNVVRPDPTKPVFIDSLVFGVEIRKAMGVKTTPSQHRVRFGGLDLRRMVAVCELCRHLRSVWTCTEMHCSSFGTLESHGEGIDINGFEVLDDGVLTPVFVLEDWGQHKVPLAKDPKLPTSNFSNRADDWPAGKFPKLSYRLAKEGGVLPPGVAELEHLLFEDVYRHIQQHWQDAGTPTKIGEVSSIMHPDHPHSDRRPPPKGKNGREAHRNHFHVQLPAATVLRQTVTHSPATVRSGDTVQLTVEQTSIHGVKTDVTKQANITLHGSTQVTHTGTPGQFAVHAAGFVDADLVVDGFRSTHRIDVVP